MTKLYPVINCDLKRKIDRVEYNQNRIFNPE